MADTPSQETEPHDEDNLDVEQPASGGGAIVNPFDPNLIRVRQMTMPVFTVCQRLGANEIELAPEFQRRAGIWSPDAKSRLIESLLIRIPLPSFYLEELFPDHYAAVDGVQRLTALKLFVVDKTLRLQGLEFLTDLMGKGYDDLPPALQRRLMETNLLVYVIEPGTPSSAKLNVFKRINTGGLALTAQEIRHAMNPGPVQGLLRDLAEGGVFAAATNNGVNDARMADREMVARFIAFRADGWKRYGSGDDLDAFVNDAMIAVNKGTLADRNLIRLRFTRAMVAAMKLFGPWAFRRPSKANKPSPVNKALFEAMSVAVDDMPDERLSALMETKDVLVQPYLDLCRSDSQFVEAVKVATGDVAKVKKRFTALRDLVASVNP